jgi:hypothetical protein
LFGIWPENSTIYGRSFGDLNKDKGCEGEAQEEQK